MLLRLDINISFGFFDPGCCTALTRHKSLKSLVFFFPEKKNIEVFCVIVFDRAGDTLIPH